METFVLFECYSKYLPDCCADVGSFAGAAFSNQVEIGEESDANSLKFDN